MPRFCRLRLELQGVKQCEVFAFLARIFPDLVFLNRLAAPETVFILGPLAMMPPLRDAGGLALCRTLREPIITPASNGRGRVIRDLYNKVNKNRPLDDQ